MYLVNFLTLGKIKYCPPKKLGLRKFEKNYCNIKKQIICKVKKYKILREKKCKFFCLNIFKIVFKPFLTSKVVRDKLK